MQNKLLSLLLLLTLNAFAQVPKGDRVLAWQVDLPQNNTYDTSFYYAKKACMESVHLFATWAGIEPNAGTFDAGSIQFLDIMNIYYPANGTKAELQIAPINTTAKETPSDLISVAFNTQNMISRFKILLDTVFAHIPNLELAALTIGNESDVFMGVDATQYANYKTFLDSVIPYAKQLYFNLHNTNLKVGTTFTLHSLIGANTSNLCQSVNVNLDIISTTYYPLNSDFTMQNPSVVASDFGSLVTQYPNTSQPIYFAECGYASSTTCNSSDFLQREFYEKVFEAWDTFYDNIKYITIFKTNDWSQQEVDDLAIYYGITSPIFKEYLRTLGVRTWDGYGSNKPAYEGILCELAARNWCAVTCDVLSTEDLSNELKLKIYPNPSNGLIYLESEYEIEKVEFFNSLGEKVLVTKATHLYINDLSKGVYNVSIHMKNGSLIKKKLVLN